MSCYLCVFSIREDCNAVILPQHIYESCAPWFGGRKVLLIYEMQKHDLSAAVAQELRDPMTYVEIAAEISLANVIVSDLMYACLG